MACHLGEMSWKFHVKETKISFLFFPAATNSCVLSLQNMFYFFTFTVGFFFLTGRDIFWSCFCCCFIFVFINFSFCLAMFCAFDMCLQFAWGECVSGYGVCAKFGTNKDLCLCARGIPFWIQCLLIDTLWQQSICVVGLKLPDFRTWQSITC